MCIMKRGGAVLFNCTGEWFFGSCAVSYNSLFSCVNGF